MKSALVNFCKPLPKNILVGAGRIGYKKLLRVEKCLKIFKGVTEKSNKCLLRIVTERGGEWLFPKLSHFHIKYKNWDHNFSQGNFNDVENRITVTEIFTPPDFQGKIRSWKITISRVKFFGLIFSWIGYLNRSFSHRRNFILENFQLSFSAPLTSSTT